MKKIILSLFILFIFNLGFAQSRIPVVMGDETEITASETLTFAIDVNSGYEQKVVVGIELNTVNTSDFDGSFYLDGSLTTNSYTTIAQLENYTFTHTSGDDNTIIHIIADDWGYSEARLRVIASGDAQSILVLPWIKTVRLR